MDVVMPMVSLGFHLLVKKSGRSHPLLPLANIALQGGRLDMLGNSGMESRGQQFWGVGR